MATFSTQRVLLPSGESLTTEEVITAFLLLAREEADFPFLGPKDVQLACLMLIPKILEINDEEEIV